MNKSITSFKDKYSFLSNFYPCQIEFEREIYPSVEHAYQAAKTMVKTWRTTIRLAKTAGFAKRLGNQAPLRGDWRDTKKLLIMEELVRKKFTGNKELAGLLLSTGNAELIEGNWWNDTFWGICKGKGENYLGKILMNVRKEICNQQGENK